MMCHNLFNVWPRDPHSNCMSLTLLFAIFMDEGLEAKAQKHSEVLCKTPELKFEPPLPETAGEA